MNRPTKRTVVTLWLCILFSWLVGWVSLRAIDQSDRDLRYPPKPIPKAVEYFLLMVPIMVAYSVSGNAHQPSEFGAWLGIFIQWTVLGVLLFLFVRIVASLRRRFKP